jgi:hypothetical protein
LITLIFLLTALTTFVLVVTGAARAIRRKPILKLARWTIGILLGYCLAWYCFWLARRSPVIPFGTDICFDDWCITINHFQQLPATSRDSTEFILAITMSNHARGIAQRPSNPRIYLIDDHGRFWPPAASGPTPLDARLELHESKNTRMNFIVPANAAHLKALIEEGPWITNLLFPTDQPLFSLR